jgi:hypothetical protein
MYGTLVILQGPHQCFPWLKHPPVQPLDDNHSSHFLSIITVLILCLLGFKWQLFTHLCPQID